MTESYVGLQPDGTGKKARTLDVTPAGENFAVVQQVITQALSDGTLIVPSQDGTDPGSPPTANLGTGIRGWLATIAAKLAGTLTVTGNVEVANDVGNPLPVSGTVTANAGTGTLAVSAAALPLPAGAATAAKQPVLGTAGASATDVLSVQGIASGTALPVSATALPLPAGASTAAKQPAIGTAGTPSVDVLTVQGSSSGSALPVSATALPLPAGAATAAKQPAIGTAGTPSADVITVQGSSSGTGLPVKQVGASTGTPSSVAGVTSDAILLAANASRQGATIYNDSTAVLYVLYGAGPASTTAYSVQVAANGYLEVPARYSGVIHGLWATATGNARVTELV